VSEYVKEFQILKGQSGITDDASLIKFFAQGLDLRILEKVYDKEMVPATIEAFMQACEMINKTQCHMPASLGHSAIVNPFIEPSTSAVVKREPAEVKVKQFRTGDRRRQWFGGGTPSKQCF
jgi:hypothetical protein